MGSDDTDKESRPLLSPRKSAAAALEVTIMQSGGSGGGSNGGGGQGGQQQGGGVRPFREVLPSWLALCRLWFQGATCADVALSPPTPHHST